MVYFSLLGHSAQPQPEVTGFTGFAQRHFSRADVMFGSMTIEYTGRQIMSLTAKCHTIHHLRHSVMYSEPVKITQRD